MSEEFADAIDGTPEASRAVSDAIQRLMAARLGRGFVPLAGLFSWGVVGVFQAGSPWMAIGAIATAAAMLGYGLRIVQKALGRRHRWWMTLAMATSLVPPAYALYVIGWVGLRGLGSFELVPSVLAILGIGLGVWVLRAWMRIVEIERLARIMTVNVDEEGGGF